MQHFLRLACAGLVLAAALPAAAQGKADTQKLMQLEQQMLDGLLKGDLGAWDRATAKSYIFTAPDGVVQTKAQVLESFKSGALKLEASTNEDMKVTFHGSTAIVTYGSTDKGSYQGQDISGRYRWTDVFVKQGKGWQLVAGQGTPLPPKK